jgi:hypothetical protein
VWVSASARVGELKQQLQPLTGVAVGGQKLMFKRVLSDTDVVAVAVPKGAGKAMLLMLYIYIHIYIYIYIHTYIYNY